MPHYTPEKIEELIETSLRRVFGDSLSPQQRTIAADIMRKIYYSVADKKTSLAIWQARVSKLQQQWQLPCETPADQALANFARLHLQRVAADAMKAIFQQSPEKHITIGVQFAAQIATRETDAVTKNSILFSYYNAGVMQGQLSKFAEALEYYQHGLNYAHTWLAELTPEAKETVIDLYYNAGVTQGQQGKLAEALEYYQYGLNYAHTWLAELTPDAKATVLSLYYNAGVTQFQQGKFAEALEYYQHGLNYAHTWLAELTPDAKAPVIKLYGSCSRIYYNLHQTSQVIALLPDNGLWSWVGFKYSDDKKEILNNWRIDLNIQYRPAQLIAAFQHRFYTLLTRDHAPDRAARPFGFITTEVLLRLSETLYALDQAPDNVRLRTVYRALYQLVEYEELTPLRHLTIQIQQLEQTQPKWGWRWLHTWQRSKIAQHFHQVQQRIMQNPEWRTMNQTVETALIDWILANCRTHLRFSDAISDFPHIILAMLLIGNGSDSAADTVRTWHTAPPWQHRDMLHTALSATHYQQWFDEGQHTPLYVWLNHLRQKQGYKIASRCKIDPAVINQPQPKLQAELAQLEQLVEKLAITWQQLQRTAHPLARLLAAFDTQDFQDTDIEAVINATQPNETHFHAALATVILGDIEQQLAHAIRHWLQFTPTSTENLLDSVAAQQHRFTRAVPIYSKTHHTVLAQQVHDWSKVRLQEILQHEAVQFPEIWALLERNRVGLHSLVSQLPEDWEEKLNQSLHQDLESMVGQLAKGYEPKDDEMWQPLQTWITYFEAHLHTARVLDWKHCQVRLHPGEALLQPFFDENQQRFYILWLDERKLQLLDFPEHCAHGSDWDTFMDNWHTALADETTDQLTPLFQNSIFARAAEYLAEIAQDNQVTQLTVIFPAPLGQLPWEALPTLENCLVREISLSHWYQNQEVNQDGAWVLGMGTIARELSCCNSEARWVAACWQTTATCPAQPLETSEVLQQLATQRRLFLSTHAGFNLHDPLASGLALGQHKTSGKITVDLPLWLCSAISTPCELLVLSACESNLTGQQTQGILSPVGIAPSFAAAGARTVIGTLWQVRDLTSLCFHYHLFTLEKTHPNLPWHQRMALARQRLREMTVDEFKNLRAQLKIEGNQLETTQCFAATVKIINQATRNNRLPFENPREWAAFTVCGAVHQHVE